MLYIIKNIDYEKIKLKYLNGKKLYKLYYNLNKHINIIGIPISFKYDSFKIINNLTYIYFTDSNILESINKLIYNKIGIYIIKYDLKIKK